MFNVKNVDEVKKLLHTTFKGYAKKKVVINVSNAKGCVVSSDIFAHEEVPHFNRSTVDGYAVKSNIIALASEANPIPLTLVGETHMGQASSFEVDENTCVYVPTGGHVPSSADAVVMVENTDVLKDEVLFYKGVSSNENLFLQGTDVQKGECIVHKGTIMSDTKIGLLKAMGISSIEVYEPLKVLIISTGDEITDKTEIEVGEVHDINTYTISSFLDSYNIQVTKRVVIQDDYDVYKTTVEEGFIENDLVIASGGSSVGEKDYTVRILDSLKAKLYVHGVNIKPGKPTIFAEVNGKPFLGLPGQPTSAYIVLNELFDSLYYGMLNITEIKHKPYVEGVLTKNVYAKQGRKLYQIVELNNQFDVTPLQAKSGMIQLLSKAYGYIVLDDNQEGIMACETVRVYRFGD